MKLVKVHFGLVEEDPDCFKFMFCYDELETPKPRINIHLSFGFTAKKTY